MMRLDFRAIMDYVESASRMKSKFIEKYWDLMQQALATERPKKNDKGKIIEEDGKPVMEENPVEQQLEAVFMLASYSSHFQRVPNQFIEIIVKQVRYIRELEAMRGQRKVKEGDKTTYQYYQLMPHSLARAKATTRKYIALVVKTLAIDLTKFNAPVAGMIEALAKEQEQSSSAFTPSKDSPNWKNR